MFIEHLGAEYHPFTMGLKRRVFVIGVGITKVTMLSIMKMKRISIRFSFNYFLPRSLVTLTVRVGQSVAH